METTLDKGRIIAKQLLSTTLLYFKDLKPSDILEYISGEYVIFNENTKKLFMLKVECI